jgi:hypothetical protein
MRSFRYYRDWHLGENRNPAFVPWHTQAYFMVWQETRDPELRDFIFEMNDWLLSIQQGQEDVPYADLAGRFYAPHGRYGPPHASSTGVYLEGLSDALRLTRAVGDSERTENYDAAIRTTVYDNRIRCDNVQHGLMGALKYLSVSGR